MNTLPTGFYPFWFWNDTIEEDEIRWQVAEMAAKGIRGFFIHSRQGLKDPAYLSETFFDRVSVAVEAAHEHGLVVHLYDEYPYPSGVAGGLVMQGTPELMATELVQSNFDVAGGPVRLALPEGKPLSLMAYPIHGDTPDWSQPLDLTRAVGVVLSEDSYQETGLTSYNQKRFFSNRPVPTLQAVLPPGRWHLVASLQRVVEHHKYWDHFADVLNPDAIQRFIELTHERYFARLAPHFGNTIRWIFTDEVVAGWSGRIPEAFRQEYGKDLLPLLPALADARHPDYLQVSADLHRLKLKRFEQVFEKPVAAWCHDHHLAYVAEKPSLRFSQLRFQDIPGCEPGHVKAGGVLDLLQPTLRGNARATASAAYFYGKDGALDECYHSLGWSATLEDVRWMADAQLLLGIRYLVPHGFFYSTHNLRKHDAPATLFFQTPYWPFFGQLSGRVDRIGQYFEGSYIAARLAVIDPTAGLPTRSAMGDYERLMHTLMGAHLDFHVVDTDLLAGGRLENGQVTLRDLSIDTVLVPPMRYIEPQLAGWLARFEESGGGVVRCPEGFDAAALLAEINARVQPSLRLKTNGQENSALWAVQRARGEQTLWMVLNVSAKAQEVSLETGGAIRELPLEEGAFSRLKVSPEEIRRVFRPFEACLIEAVPEPPPSQTWQTLLLPLAGELEVMPLAPNLARLYDWQLSLLDREGNVWQSGRVPAVPLANQLEQGGFRIPTRVERVFGTPPLLAWPDLTLRYETRFHNQYNGKVELVMEPGSIVGDWTIRVNGKARFGPADFQPTQAHVRGSLSVALGESLVSGENTLTVEVDTHGPDYGLLNPLYLAGDFGVSLSPLTLANRPLAGQFESYTANRLPFFAGATEYRRTFQVEQIPSTPHLVAQLDPPGDFHEACEFSLNGGTWHALPWGPYQVEIDPHELHPGENRLAVRVYTTLIRSFEGQEFDYGSHRYVAIQP